MEDERATCAVYHLRADLNEQGRVGRLAHKGPVLQHELQGQPAGKLHQPRRYLQQQQVNSICIRLLGAQASSTSLNTIPSVESA